MYVISRKRDESIVIDDDIQVKVLEVNHNKGIVVLGIKAPREKEIKRQIEVPIERES